MVHDHARRASKEKGSKSAAVKEWKDMTLVARQLHHVVMTVLDSDKHFSVEERRDMLLQIGAVLALPMCHSEGGARHAQKARAMAFVENNCPDAVQRGPFYDFEGHAVDFPTEMHRTPPPRVLGSGGLEVLHHFEDVILEDYFKQGEGTKFVAICNDIGTYVPPIKTPEQQSWMANVGSLNLSGTRGHRIAAGKLFFARAGTGMNSQLLCSATLTSIEGKAGMTIRSSSMGRGVSYMAQIPCKPCGGRGVHWCGCKRSSRFVDVVFRRRVTGHRPRASDSGR